LLLQVDPTPLIILLSVILIFIVMGSIFGQNDHE